MLKGASSFSQTVAAAQCKGRSPQLVIDPGARTATAGGERLKLTSQNFALLLWMARRRRERRGPLPCSKDRASGSAREFLDLVRELSGGFSGEFERAENALRNGMDSTWFSPAKNRLHKALIRALGESGALPYLIHAVGNRREALFELTLEPGQILIQGDSVTLALSTPVLVGGTAP